MSVRSTPAPVLITHFGENWIRGSERCLLDLLTHLDRHRFAPIVWCNGSVLAERVRALGIPVHQSPFTLLLGRTRPRLDLSGFARLVREGQALVARYGVEVIHSNSLAPTQWLVPVARRTRLPLLSHLHAPYAARDRFTLGLHHATVAVGVTQGCLDDLIADGFPADRTEVVYNGVDTSSWPEHDQTGLRAALGIGRDEVVIAQVGSLIRRKGHDLLFRAVATLRDAGNRCRVLVVGDGPDREQIERASRDLGLESVVHFLGFVPHPPGIVFRDVADIAVSASRGEGFGLTVIEAGAAGRPVVATDTTGMREILTDGTDGLVVPIEDVPALASALGRLIADPALRAGLGSALRRTVEARFTVHTYANGIQRVYDRLRAMPRESLSWRGSAWEGQTSSLGRWLLGAMRRRLVPGAPGIARPESF